MNYKEMKAQLAEHHGTSEDEISDYILLYELHAAIERHTQREAQRVKYIHRKRPDVCKLALSRELTPREYGVKLLNRKRNKK